MANIILTPDDLKRLASKLNMPYSKLLNVIHNEKETNQETGQRYTERPVVDLRIVPISKIMSTSNSSDVKKFLKTIVINTKSAKECKVSRKKIMDAVGMNEMQLLGISSGLSRAIKKVCQGQKYYLHESSENNKETFYNLLGITYDEKEPNKIKNASLFESNLKILKDYFQ